MSISVEAEGLADLLEETNRRLVEVAAGNRATNVLLLAQAMGVKDVTEPVTRAKVLRHLELLEDGVSRDE